MVIFFPLYITTGIFFLGTSWVWARVKVQSPTLPQVCENLCFSGLPVLYSPLGTGSAEDVESPGIDASGMVDAQLQTLNTFGL